MAYKHLDILQGAPYYDDFEATKNFLQVLFRPGYAVQARELTQLQTILQNQISKVGDHLFLDGTHVYGAKITSGYYYYFARIQNITDIAGNAKTNVTTDTFKNKCFCPVQIKFKGNAQVYTTRNSPTPSLNDIDALENDMQIEIVDVLEQTSSDDWIVIFKINKGTFGILDNTVADAVDYSTPLIFREITTGGSGNVTSLKTFSNVNNVNSSPIQFAFKQQTLDVSSRILIENTNQVLSVAISSGIFYKDGRFIQTPETLIPLYKLSEKTGTGGSGIEIESTMYDSSSYVNYSSTLENRKLFSYPSKKVGFKIDYVTITETSDSTLYDNAAGYPNYNAPGAARLKAEVTVISEKFDPNDIESYKSKTSDGKDFIELVRYKKGIIQSIKAETEYNEILKLFASRTYDESGSYTVNPFKVEIKEHLKKDIYQIKFQTTPTTGSVEIGDMIFRKWQVTESVGTAAATRLVDLIFPTQDKTGSKKYPTEYSEPIGIVTKIESNSIYVEMLNIYSFSSLPNGVTISRKANDTITGSVNDITDIGTTVTTGTACIFIPDKSGLYTLGDTPAGDDDKAALLLNPGKGYIEGFKVENFNSSVVEIPKGRSEDHKITDTSTIDFTKLENIIYMKSSDDFLLSTDSITDKYINIKADNSLIAVYFAGVTQDDYADASVISWTPFEQGNLVNNNTPNNILSPLNKQSVLFVSSENSPVLEA